MRPDLVLLVIAIVGDNDDPIVTLTVVVATLLVSETDPIDNITIATEPTVLDSRVIKTSLSLFMLLISCSSSNIS